MFQRVIQCDDIELEIIGFLKACCSIPGSSWNIQWKGSNERHEKMSSLRVNLRKFLKIAQRSAAAGAVEDLAANDVTTVANGEGMYGEMEDDRISRIKLQQEGFSV